MQPARRRHSEEKIPLLQVSERIRSLLLSARALSLSLSLSMLCPAYCARALMICRSIADSWIWLSDATLDHYHTVLYSCMIMVFKYPVVTGVLRVRSLFAESEPKYMYII